MFLDRTILFELVSNSYKLLKFRRVIFLEFKERMWKSIADRREKEVALFERKFLDYRNKMHEVIDQLEESQELPELKDELKRFMQDEQGDVTFGRRLVENQRLETER